MSKKNENMNTGTSTAIAANSSYAKPYKSTEISTCVIFTSVLNSCEISFNEFLKYSISDFEIVRRKKLLCIGLSLILDENLSGKRATITSLFAGVESLTIKSVCEKLIDCSIILKKPWKAVAQINYLR